MLARARCTLLYTRCPLTAPSCMCLHDTSRAKMVIPVLDTASYRMNQEGLHVANFLLLANFQVDFPQGDIGKVIGRNMWRNCYQNRSRPPYSLHLPLLQSIYELYHIQSIYGLWCHDSTHEFVFFFLLSS